MILRNLSLTVMVKLKVVDDGLVANPLYLNSENWKLICFNHFRRNFCPQNNIIKNIKHKGDSLAEKYAHNVKEKADIPITNTFTWNNFYNYALQSRPRCITKRQEKHGVKIVCACDKMYHLH